MKKVIIYLCIVSVLFVLLAVIHKQNGAAEAVNNENGTVETENEQNSASETVNNPYDKSLDELDPATVESLNDPYTSQNIITLNDLKEKLDNKEILYVYFFNPLCSHCKDFTPMVVTLAKEMGIDLKLLNVLEYEEAWDLYNIKGTPSIYHFVNGRIDQKVTGSRTEDYMRRWFKTIGNY